jgi:uncharacterized protein (TIGR00369 family)
MTDAIEFIEAARQAGDPAQLIARIPYARTLGITMDLVDDEIVGRMDFADQLVGDVALRALHGGTIGALLESTAVVALLWQADSIRIPKTIGITVEYLRSGRPKQTFARAEVTRQGRRVANVRVHAYQDDPDRPIAAATAHFLLPTETT